MFDGAVSFHQNLGNWYVVPDSMSIVQTAVPGVVGSISAQNTALDSHNPVYNIVPGSDSTLFAIVNGNQLNMISVDTESDYTVNVTASEGTVFEDGNNWRVLEVTVLPASVFVTTWKPVSGSLEVSIPVEVHTGETLSVSWGDGESSTHTTDGTISHTYDTAGEYQVAMTGGLSRINLGASDSTASLLESIDQWGAIRWTSMESAFEGASAMTYGATDTPDLSRVTDIKDMFLGATAFDGDLTNWNVSSVTHMDNMFRDTSFDGDLSSWNVSSVTHMDNMFRGATAFDGDLSNWDVSSVTRMAAMFNGATFFNQSLSSWNVSSVKSMSQMFRDTSFDGDLSSWDVSSVTAMAGMFRSTPFNQPLSSWNVSSVTAMDLMFRDATLFNQSLNGWDVSSILYMGNMFGGATSFNQNLGNWYVVPDSMSIARADVPNIVGTISAQNTVLNDHSPVYTIVPGSDSTRFAIVNGNQLNMISVGTQSAYTVNVTASGDDVFENGNNWRVFDVTVTGNVDPVLNSIGSKSVDELATLSFNATATDGNNDTLEFSLTGTPPSGASIHQDTGVFSWTPSESQDGTHTIAVRVDDGNGGSDSETITVTVNEVNEDPVLNSIGPKSANQLEQLTFTATATDGDTVGGTADTIEFSLTGTPPTGASINQNTGVFSWTPTASQTGAYIITFQVQDGAGATDSEDVTVTVTVSNQNPVLGSIGSKSVDELATLSFNATATDGNNDALEFSLTGTPPSGASINSTSGAFSWTPTELQDGSHSVTVRVSDGNGGSDSETITVTVNEVNEDPVLASVGSKQVNELAALSFTASASDGDTVGGTADTLEFSLTGTPPSGASIHQDTGVFSWTPSESQDGTHTIAVRVDDGNGGSDSETITVTVNEVNEDPVLNSIGPKSANQLEQLTFTATATDGDTVGGTADTIEFSLTGTPPTGASINQNTGVFSWTPTASQTGAYIITFQVQDGAGATDSEDVTVTVTVSNQNPVLGSIGSKSVDELATLSFNATATDGNNDTLEFSLTGTPPSGASINSTSGAFSWTPTELQDGSHSVTVRVSDGNGGSDSETITVTVNEVNEDPVLASVGSKQVNELAALSFTASASDGDTVGGTADTLEFSLTGTPPSGASIHQDTGVFSWTPSESQDGTHTIAVRVDDGNGGSDSETITVTVNEVNEDPVLTSVGSKQVNELAALSFTASASDGDTVGGTADTLEFSLTGTPPSGASIHQDTGAFSWTPSESQDGTHTIAVRVDDGNGGSDSETITVTVNEVNEDPVLNSIGPKSANQLEQLTFTATATDGDTVGGTADTIEFSLTGTPPTGASINQNTGVFSWTPTASQTGAYIITFQVQDGAGATDSEDVTVTVTVSNQNPVLGSIGSKSVDELATLSFNATATDGNNDTLEFSLTGTPPSGASINSTSGAFSWTPTELQDGSHSVTVRVSDGNGGSDSETITVTVNEVNEDPVLTSVGSKQVNELAALSFTASASDGDTVGGTADTLEFSLTGTPPSGASIHQDTGAFSWTPSESQDGTHTIAVRVEDGNGGSDSEAITVTVNEVNEDPVLTSVGSKQVNELAALSFTASASDGDTVGGRPTP